MKQVLSLQQISDGVEKLHSLRAQIASLQETEQSLADMLKKEHVGVLGGVNVDAVIFRKEVERVDVQALAAHLKINQKILKRFTVTKRHKCIRIIPKRIGL